MQLFVYVSEGVNQTIRKVTPSGVVTTIAGLPSVAGTSGGLGAAARFNFPRGIGVDATGNLYVADFNSSTIRKLTPQGGQIIVLEDSGNQTINGFAINIPRGRVGESGQTVNFIVSNDNNSLFVSQPAISLTGALTFTPAANANGSANVTVLLHDNGGTANGGVDTSAPQTFLINVLGVNDAPLGVANKR